MKSICLVFMFCQLLSAQNKVTVYTVPDNTPAYFLEMELVKNLFKLYNATNDENLKFQIVELKKFSELFTALNSNKNPDYVLAIYQITVTDERKKKFFFSKTYLPIKESIFTKTDHQDLDFTKAGTRIGYQAGSTQEEQFKRMDNKKLVPIIFDHVGAKLQALLDGKADFVIGDNIETWGKKEFKLVKDFDYQAGNGFGMMYTHGSSLRDKLDPSLIRYIKSQSYFNFLYKHYGIDVAKYYRKNMTF